MGHIAYAVIHGPICYGVLQSIFENFFRNFWTPTNRRPSSGRLGFAERVGYRCPSAGLIGFTQFSAFAFQSCTPSFAWYCRLTLALVLPSRIREAKVWLEHAKSNFIARLPR